jgi:hypothetical protein
MNVDQGIFGLEIKIGTKRGFFNELLDADDWSFVIKLHAFFEAVCTHLLLFHFKDPELNEILSRIELSNKKTGKIAFLEKLGLIGTFNRRLIATLSEMRNSLVHDVRNSEFNLNSLVNNLNDGALKNFALSFSPYESSIRRMQQDPIFRKRLDPKLSEQVEIENIIKRAKENPKLHIWLGAHNTLVSIVDMYSYSDYKQWVKAKQLFEEEDYE